MRNIQNLINEGLHIMEKHPRRCMTPHELYTLKHESDIFEALTNAYYMGVATGSKIAKQEGK